MNIRQQLLKRIYPLLMRMGKSWNLKSSIWKSPPNAKALTSIYKREVTLNNKEVISLEKFAGKKLLLVNTASNCGYTAQYAELQQLHDQYISRLEVIAFPANDFKEQEAGSDEEIAQFCQLNFGVTFPLVQKSQVIKGEGQHPVFSWLTNAAENGWCNQEPEWNFSKYLVNESGQLTHYFAPGVSPLDPRIIKVIEGK